MLRHRLVAVLLLAAATGAAESVQVVAGPQYRVSFENAVETTWASRPEPAAHSMPHGPTAATAHCQIYTAAIYVSVAATRHLIEPRP